MTEEETTTGPETVDTGQVDADPAGTTADAPGSTDGQSAADETTGQAAAPGGDTEDTFFDPEDLDPALSPAYKNMQAAYTKKMQEIAGNRHKIEAFDAFNADPLTVIQQQASRMGYQLTRADAAQIAQQQQGAQGGEFEPQNWNEVLDKASQMAEQRMMQKFAPVLNQVQEMKKTSIEQELSSIDPTWQQYEGEMRQNLQSHPSLANDPGMLYRMSVPPEVMESRATQKALKKLEGKAKSSRVSGISKTNKNPATGLPEGPVSFTDAVLAARQSLAAQGIRKEG